MGVAPCGARVKGGDRESGVCNGEEGRVEKAKARERWRNRSNSRRWPCRDRFDGVGLVAVRGQARWLGGGATIVAPSSGSQ
ncbi:unnamed protein product [Sphenostylis stenocarpa]|uniref:Uncharacterized protein n=1 Tax=Sphenostylis stenocarpa TaxID=92480 RepID=A0AA86VIL0_9FABA|nr:unnamed protein product [Sphenostylis stenocarpa]